MPTLRHALVPTATCLTLLGAGLPGPARAEPALARRAEPAPAVRAELETAADEQLTRALAATWQAFVDRPRTHGRWEVFAGAMRFEGDWLIDGSASEPVVLVARADETVCSVGGGRLTCRRANITVLDAALADLPASTPPSRWPRALVRWDCVQGSCHAVTIGSFTFAPAAWQPRAQVAQLRELYRLVIGNAIDAGGMFTPIGTRAPEVLSATVYVTRPLPYQAPAGQLDYFRSTWRSAISLLRAEVTLTPTGTRHTRPTWIETSRVECSGYTGGCCSPPPPTCTPLADD
ncbi:MAG: hypothetical protein IPQ07_23380 [Myxococcales bacterium]|nr:hypothetical protein [Myxococcales bacterium]